MSNIADKLNALVSAKNDMKTALESKGVSPTGGLSTYADAIRSIEQQEIVSGAKLPDGTKFQYSTFTTVPLFDTSAMTDMSSMFRHCSALTTIPQFDTSNVTDMNGMFEGCSNLTTIPQFDTSNVIAFGDRSTDTTSYQGDAGMFEGCSNLIQIPKLNTTNGQYFSKMFENCVNLTTIPELDTSNAIVIDRMFKNCSSLESLPLIDCSSLEVIILDNTNKYEDPPTKDIVKGCINLTHVGGFKNLGKSYPSTRDKEGTSFTFDILDLSSCTKLTTESINNIINNLYDRVSAGYEGRLRIIWSEDSKSKLTTEMINKLINKGYIYTTII